MPLIFPMLVLRWVTTDHDVMLILVIQSHKVTNEAYTIENNPQKVIMVLLIFSCCQWSGGHPRPAPGNGDKDGSSTGTISQPRRQPGHNLADAALDSTHIPNIPTHLDPVIQQ